MNQTTRAGVVLALATALISGVSIYLNKFASQTMADAVIFTTLKNSLVGLALIASLVTRMRPIHTLRLGRRWWFGLGMLALIGGSLPFLLFFEGLSQTSAPSAALIHKSLFLWVALLAAALLGERPHRWTLVGLGLLAVGQLISGWPANWGWGQGETLVLLATLLWAVETIVARRILPDLPETLAATARMAGGAVVMWLYVFASGRVAGMQSLSLDQWGWIAITSLLLLGYVTTWYAALQRAPATIVTSLLTAGAVITTALNALEGSLLATTQSIGLLIMCAGLAWMLRMLRIDRGRDVRFNT